MKKRIFCIIILIFLMSLPMYSVGEQAMPGKMSDTEFKTIATGNFTLAVKADNSLWAWGASYSGQLGDGTSEWNRTTPVKVMDNVVSVASGSSHSLAIKEDGSLWAWGWNAYGQLGDGRDEWEITTPVKIMDDVVSIAAGSFYSLAIKKDGSLWAWGDNRSGQLGNGKFTTYDDNYNPIIDNNESKPIKIMEDIISVAAIFDTSYAVKKDGSMWAWGAYEWGLNVKGINSLTPVKILDEVAFAYAGAAIKTDGSLWTWGANGYGQLGDGTKNNRQTPEKIMDDVADVAVGAPHSLAIKTDGSLWAWGWNAYGQLGDGTTISKIEPIKIMDNVSAIAIGHENSIAVKMDGSLWAWGRNYYGQLGDGTVLQKHSPVKILEGMKLSSRVSQESISSISEIKVIINGKQLTFDQPPIIENDRALVPLRAIFEALGADVKWEQSTQTVTAVKDDITITLKIGSNILVKNGKEIKLDVPAKIVGDRTLVPVRAVAESFGADVKWEASTRTVTITD